MGTFVLFADDTNIFVQGESKRDAYNKAGLVLEAIYKYMQLNELHINMSKCCYMYFNPYILKKIKDADQNNPQLYINGIPIKHVTSTRFLGVVIDEKLTWSDHIEQLCKKLNCQAGILNRIKECVPSDLYRDLYFTLFESHLTYCISVWGGVGENRLDPLFVIQKRCIRILFGNKETFLDKFMTCVRCRSHNHQILGEKLYCKEHTKPLFNKHKIMTVHNIYNYQCTIEIFKILKLRTPISLFSKFNISTRKETLLITPSPTTLFVYKSAILWNSLKDRLCIYDFSVKISHVKSKLKDLILSKQQSGPLPTLWDVGNYQLIKN